MPRHYTVLHPLESGPDVRVYVLSDRLGLAPRRVLTLFSKTSPGGVELDQAEDLFSLRFSLVYSSLIPVLDLSFRGNRPGIVTEFLTDCKPLKPSGLVPPTVAVSLSVQLAEALSYLHCKGFFCGYLTVSEFQSSELFSETALSSQPGCPETAFYGSSGKWGGGTWFGAFRIPNLVPRSLVNIVGCSSRGRGNCGKLRAISNWASKPVIRSFPSAVRTVEKQLRALASSPPELLVFPRFA